MLVTSAAVTLANPVIIPGGSVTLSGTSFAGISPTPLTFSGPASFPSGTATATLTVNNSATFSNIVGGTGTGIITLAGLGTIAFTQSNTFTNPVTVNMANPAFLGAGGVFGSVVLGSDNALGAGTNLLNLTSGACNRVRRAGSRSAIRSCSATARWPSREVIP